MVFIIIHGIVYDAFGMPGFEVLDCYFVDLCDADQREEHERMASMLRGCGVRIEAHALDNTNIPQQGKPFGFVENMKN